MSIEPLLALIAIAVIANLVVMAALVIVPARRASGTDDRPGVERDVAANRMLAAAAVIGGEDEDRARDGVPTRTYDRVVRIVSWVFLLATTIIVVATGLWPENQPAILVLVALAVIAIFRLRNPSRA